MSAEGGSSDMGVLATAMNGEGLTAAGREIQSRDAKGPLARLLPDMRRGEP